MTEPTKIVPKLTIAVPTYNRSCELAATVAKLLPQITPEVELIVLDNASAIPAQDVLAELLKAYPDRPVQIIRNQTNVGANSNILRTFEYAAAEWLWILGDDDLVAADAVAIVLAAICERPDASFLNFRSREMETLGARNASFDTVGQDGFVRGLDYPGGVNFMSVGIWRVPHAKPFLYRAYHYAYSMSHSFVLLLSMLGLNRVVHFDHRVVIESVTEADAGARWRFRDFIMGWNTILELPMSDKTRKIMSRKMINWHAPENVCAYLLAEAAIRKTGMRDYILASHRLAPHVTAFERLRFFVYRLLFLAPGLGWAAVRSVIKLAVVLKLKGIDLHDIEGRSANTNDSRR